MKNSSTTTVTVLIVDDEEYIRILVQRILQEEGYGVVTVANGQEALDKISQAGIDLVLLDIRMPKLDGFQVLDIIRQRSDIPIIMLTGIVEKDTLSDALNCGADDYITKPFSRHELVARVKAKLRRTGR